MSGTVRIEGKIESTGIRGCVRVATLDGAFYVDHPPQEWRSGDEVEITIELRKLHFKLGSIA